MWREIGRALRLTHFIERGIAGRSAARRRFCKEISQLFRHDRSPRCGIRFLGKIPKRDGDTCRFSPAEDVFQSRWRSRHSWPECPKAPSARPLRTARHTPRQPVNSRKTKSHRNIGGFSFWAVVLRTKRNSSANNPRAEPVGFEPTVGSTPTQLFESCTFGRSDTVPSTIVVHRRGQPFHRLGITRA